jgi:TetR/AcrR family transcriptional regulator
MNSTFCGNAKGTEGIIRQNNKALIFNAAKEEFVTYGFKRASMKCIFERENIAC